MGFAEDASVERVERLLEKTGTYATINMQDEDLKSFALHSAIYLPPLPSSLSPLSWGDNESVRIAKLLLLAGADPHVKNWRGKTPLQLAQGIHSIGSISPKVDFGFLQEVMERDTSAMLPTRSRTHLPRLRQQPHPRSVHACRFCRALSLPSLDDGLLSIPLNL